MMARKEKSGIYTSRQVVNLRGADKLHVVFDCSARCEGYSLNNYLLQGLDLITSINCILIRFRQHPIAFICDVEKMYHQFHVNKSDLAFWLPLVEGWPFQSACK